MLSCKKLLDKEKDMESEFGKEYPDKKSTKIPYVIKTILFLILNF